MAFSQNAAWTWWCFTSASECHRFNAEFDNAMFALRKGWDRPARNFLEEWRQLALMNDALGEAIGESLDQVQQSLGDTIVAVTEPIARGFKPLMGIAVLGIVGLLVWKS